MKKRITVPIPTQCEPINHHFCAYDLTPVMRSSGMGKTSDLSRSVVLFCDRCGEVRALVEK